MNKVEHIGIAVRNLTTSIPLFTKILNTECYKTEEVNSEKVRTAFLERVIRKLNYWKAQSLTE